MHEIEQCFHPVLGLEQTCALVILPSFYGFVPSRVCDIRMQLFMANLEQISAWIASFVSIS